MTTKLEEAAARYREARSVALLAEEKVKTLRQQAHDLYTAANAASLDSNEADRALSDAAVALHVAAAEEL